MNLNLINKELNNLEYRSDVKVYRRKLSRLLNTKKFESDLKSLIFDENNIQVLEFNFGFFDVTFFVSV